MAPMRSFRAFFCLALSLSLLAACAAPPARPVAAPTSSPRPALTTTAPVLPARTASPARSTATSSGAVSGPFVSSAVAPAEGVALASSVALTLPPLSGALDILPITLAENGRQVNLSVGQRMLLQLRENYAWQVTLSSPAVLNQVTDQAIPSGSQSLFEARQPGRTNLTAIGDPLCRNTKPPCALPSIRFQVEIIVR